MSQTGEFRNWNVVGSCLDSFRCAPVWYETKLENSETGRLRLGFRPQFDCFFISKTDLAQIHFSRFVKNPVRLVLAQIE